MEYLQSYTDTAALSQLWEKSTLTSLLFEQHDWNINIFHPKLAYQYGGNSFPFLILKHLKQLTALQDAELLSRPPGLKWYLSLFL